jgi:hypothetical protein
MGRREGGRVASVVERIDRYVSLADSGTGRMLWTRLHRDNRGNPELFVLAYAVKSVLHHGEPMGGARTTRQSRRTEPFLWRWQGAMNHWASRNGDFLKHSLSGCESAQIPRSVHARDHVPATPAAPAPPASISPMLRALDPLSAPLRPLLPAL